MNCPNCGAPIHLLDGRDSAICDYCSAVYLPEKNDDGVRVFDQASERNCPRCQLPLLHATMVRNRILYCTRCHGALIAMPVFVVLVEALRSRRSDGVEIASRPDPRELDRAATCPGCGAR